MKVATDVWGLILAGGKSSRMGKDKGLLHYHNKPQRDYIFEQLNDLLPSTYLSLRSDQKDDYLNLGYVIYDENIVKGPFNGLLSAHHKFPDVAWLVIACDLPLMNKEGLTFLLEHRDPNSIATALTRSDSDLPEPLAAIWEPKGLQLAETYLKNAISSCPRKFLINHNCHSIAALTDEWLENANNPEDFEKLTTKLSNY
jgi:molybdopterin-guanine dinucleotide biosynthesis protein A